MIRKIENNAILEIEEIKDMTRKALVELKIRKREELERKLRFLTVTNKSFKKLVGYEEEKEARKITRKTMKEIEDFKTEI